MKQERMLYIMGIDWMWIRQRPQIIAESLANDYELTVVFPRSIIALAKKRPVNSKIRYHILWTLPYQEKNVLIGKISSFINTRLFKKIDEFAHIYIGYPLYTRYIPASYKGNIIYDCMDNYEFLYPDSKRVNILIEQETQLILRCNILIASSALLQKKLNKIAGFDKSILVRNGTNVSHVHAIKAPVVKTRYHIGYIGTISDWLDIHLLEYSLEVIQNIEYHLIGPVLYKESLNSNLTFHGSCSHEKLWKAIIDYDCLIMPFRVNDITIYVDPVKLYEYITFGKCIISIYYPEIERFKDFVYFYRNAREYIQLLLKLIDTGFPPKYTEDQRTAFLCNNTWDNRFRQLQEAMENFKSNNIMSQV